MTRRSLHLLLLIGALTGSLWPAGARADILVRPFALAAFSSTPATGSAEAESRGLPTPAATSAPVCNAAYCVPDPWVGYGWQVAGVTDGFYKAGQVFKPLVSGALTEVQIGLSSLGPHPAVAEIRTVVGGLPTATVLASVVVPGAFYSDRHLHTASFEGQNVMLDAGASYALVMRASGPTVITVLGRYPACNVSTTGSSHFVDTYDFGATWQARTDRSFAYRICVEAVVPARTRSWGGLKLHYR